MPEKTQDISVEAFGDFLQVSAAKSTTIKYMQILQLFLAWLESNGYTSITSLPQDILDQYISYVHLEKGLTPSATRLYVAAIKKYFEWLRRKNVHVTFFKPRMPKVTHRMGSILDTAALQKYLDAMKDLKEPVRTALLIAPFVGLRVSELAALRLDSIFMATVPYHGQNKQTMMIRLKGKGGKERVVPVLEEGRTILMAYLKNWRAVRNGKYLFPSTETKRPISEAAIRKALAKSRTDLVSVDDDVTMHTFRRTYAVSLYRRGMSIDIIAKILGHAKTDTLLKHYLALDEVDILRDFHGAEK
jgi:site-specific recombinase XerD